MPGSRSDKIHEERDTNSNSATDPPTSQGFDTVKSLFKTCLKTCLEHKGKEL